MVTNIIVTGLTAGRIWYVAFYDTLSPSLNCNFWRYVARTLDAKSFGESLRRYRLVIVLIVESGAFMAISKIIEFTLFKLAPDDGLNGLNALYIPMDCMPQIMVSSLFICNTRDFFLTLLYQGICPTFILLAVSTGLSSPGATAHTPHSGNGAYLKQVKGGPGHYQSSTAGTV